MKRRNIIFILIVVVLSGIAAWSIPLETTDEILPVTLNVTHTSRELGFAVTQEEVKYLNFGTTFPGTTVIKTVNITRGTQPPAYVTIIPQGDIANWLVINESSFLLEDPKQITVSVKVPTDAKEGIYSGHIGIRYSKTVFLSIIY